MTTNPTKLRDETKDDAQNMEVIPVNAVESTPVVTVNVEDLDDPIAEARNAVEDATPIAPPPEPAEAPILQPEKKEEQPQVEEKQNAPETETPPEDVSFTKEANERITARTSGMPSASQFKAEQERKAMERALAAVGTTVDEVANQTGIPADIVANIPMQEEEDPQASIEDVLQVPTHSDAPQVQVASRKSWTIIANEDGSGEELICGHVTKGTTEYSNEDSKSVGDGYDITYESGTVYGYITANTSDEDYKVTIGSAEPPDSTGSEIIVPLFKIPVVDSGPDLDEMIIYHEGDVQLGGDAVLNHTLKVTDNGDGTVDVSTGVISVNNKNVSVTALENESVSDTKYLIATLDNEVAPTEAILSLDETAPESQDDKYDEILYIAKLVATVDGDNTSIETTYYHIGNFEYQNFVGDGDYYDDIEQNVTSKTIERDESKNYGRLFGADNPTSASLSDDDLIVGITSASPHEIQYHGKSAMQDWLGQGSTLPDGGTTYQVLQKKSSANQDVEWNWVRCHD